MTKAEEDKLFRISPSRVYFLKGKEAEKELNFAGAINFYQLAYDMAVKRELATAVNYMWHRDLCLEKRQIFEEMKEKLIYKPANVGYVEGDSVYVFWLEAYKVVPRDIMNKAETIVKRITPYLYDYPIVKYNTKDQSVEFIKTRELYTEMEPRLLDSVYVKTDGTCERRPPNIDPPVLLHKWAIFSGTTSLDRAKCIRRAIKLEFLKMPPEIKEQAKHSKFFSQYVRPYIGNRNLGKSLKLLKGV